MMEYWDLFIIGGNWALAIYFLLRSLRVGGKVWLIFIFWTVLSSFLTWAVFYGRFCKFLSTFIHTDIN